jgi:hypothetical protein
MMLMTRARPTRLRRTPRHLLLVVAMAASACPLGARLMPASAADPAVITTIVGVNVGRTNEGRAVELSGPRTAAVDGTGAVWFTDTGHHQIKRLDPTTDLVTVVAGTGFAGGPIGDGGPALRASLNMPHGVALDNPGGAPRTLYIADSANNRIRKVALDSGVITTVAGTGRPAFGGDGGPAATAPLDHPRFMLVAPDGSLIVADTGNARVRSIDPSGIIRTIAGTGQRGYAGDGGRATSALLDDPRGLALDADGNLYISSAEGVAMPSVRRVEPNGIITTVAGGHPAGYSGDGGPATAAALNAPRSIAVWGTDLYIADSDNSRIRQVDLVTGVITTVAGTGVFGYGGDGGPAITAQLDQPRGVAVTPRGDLVIGDTRNARLRFVRIPRTTTPPPPVTTPPPAVAAEPSAPPTPDPAGNEPRTDPLPVEIQPFGVDDGPAVLRPPGYRMVASDGGIFAFGDAGFFGSTGGLSLAKPIVGMAPVPSSAGSSGAGYWLVASDGGIFAFGDAGFFGSPAGRVTARPVTGLLPSPTGRGYLIATGDGRIFSFGDAPFLGEVTEGLRLPVVGVAG